MNQECVSGAAAGPQTVKLWVRALQSMSGQCSCHKLLPAVIAVSVSSSSAGLHARVEPSCEPAGPVLRPPRPGAWTDPQKRFLGFYNVMADFTATARPQATNATLDQILCFMEANFCTLTSSVTF